MDLFEFQGKSLFARVGVPVPAGREARTPQEARQAAAELGGRVVVKAQVQVGGRGKAGGIKVAADPAESVVTSPDEGDEEPPLLPPSVSSIDTGPTSPSNSGFWLVHAPRAASIHPNPNKRTIAW